MRWYSGMLFISNAFVAVVVTSRSSKSSSTSSCMSHQGLISPLILAIAVSCPANSDGADVASGCVCNAGYAGEVVATAVAPFYNNSCTPVECPNFSNGPDVVEGCACNAGYNGSVTATAKSPFYYESTCTGTHGCSFSSI